MKAIVESAQFIKEGEGQYGKYYVHEIRLKGDPNAYQYISKANPQDKFVEGREVEANIETKQNGQYTNHMIKPVQTSNFGGANNPSRLELDRKIAALNNSVSLVASGKIGLTNLKETYEKLLNEYL